MSTLSPSKTFDLQAVTRPMVDAVESYLARVIDERAMPGNLREAVRYALLGGGKRLRPILTICSCQAAGGGLDDAMPAAAAIEMIHCFSLVHDDLPAMDDDDLRRGRPTLHKHTNEAMAILAGDMMMGLAFEVIASRVQPADLASSVSAELSVGTNDMIAGQVYDTLPDFDDEIEPMQRLQTIHRHKTGALFRAACRMGVLCATHGKPAEASQAALAGVTRYADAVGLMFQVVDDLLDVTQTTEHLGKSAGKDAQQGKMTYPGLLGIEASRAEVKRLRREACDALQSMNLSVTSSVSGKDADRQPPPSGEPDRDQAESRPADRAGLQTLQGLCEYLAVRTR